MIYWTSVTNILVIKKFVQIFLSNPRQEKLGY